jgi:hypothetical protein
MIFSDSVHGNIEIPDKYRTLLSTAPLTRLRNVRQLGFTPAVYTGAVHTRFEHTIGKTYVLMGLLDQFRVSPPATRERYIVAALLSEIGSYPLSHSSSWLFEERLQMSKDVYARLLSDHIRPLSASEKDFIWDRSHPDHEWFRNLPAFAEFPDVDILQLAGDIDYALRDAHYSGRYTNSFDYRYFRTLVDTESERCQQELNESVKELYRSIYALNSVYGDPVRRFITLIFIRLLDFLVDKGYLDVERYRKPAEYLLLDDDRFIAHVGKAAIKAAGDGVPWTVEMFEYVKQLKPVEIHQLELSPELRAMSVPELERAIADKQGLADPVRVVAMNDTMPNAPKYVLFGQTFDCYSNAIGSDYFCTMTGLKRGTNRTGLWDNRYLFYTIIEPISGVVLTN